MKLTWNQLQNALQWRHNDHDCVWSHQPHGCLLTRLFRRRSKKTSKLRVTGLCAGNSPGPVNSPHKGPVTRKMFPFDDVIMVRMGLMIISWKWRRENLWLAILMYFLWCAVSFFHEYIFQCFWQGNWRFHWQSDSLVNVSLFIMTQLFIHLLIMHRYTTNRIITWTILSPWYNGNI